MHPVVKREVLSPNVTRLEIEASRIAQEMGLTQWDVSLTHTQDHASAVAVAL